MKKHTFLTFLSFFLILGTAFAQQDAAIKRAIEIEKYKTAKDLLQKNIAQNPNEGANYYWMGKIYLLQSKSDSASQFFNLGKDKPVNGWMNLIGLGRILLDKKDSVNAKNYFNDALKIATEKSALYFLLVGDAWVHSEIRSSENGLKNANKCLALEKGNTDAMILQGDAWVLKLEGGGQALTSYENASEKNPANVLPLFKIGELYLRARNFPLAVDNFKQLLAKDSSFAPAYRELAEYYFNAKKINESRMNYEKFLALSDATEEILTQYLFTCFLSKDYEKCLALIEQLKSSNFNAFVLNRITAYTYYEKGKYPEGLSSIQQLFANPDSAHLIADDYMYYGKLLVKTKQDSLAVIYYQRAYEKDSSNKEILGEIGKSALAMKKYDLAKEMFQKKIAESKPIPLDYFNLGQALYYLNDYVNADSAFLQLTILQPAFYQGFLFRGRCNNFIDSLVTTDIAKQNYEKVIEMASADPVKNKKNLIEAYNYLAFYSIKKDDNPNAVLFYKKVLELDPENKDALENIKVLKKEK